MIGINGRFLARAQPTGMQRAAAALVNSLYASGEFDLCFIGDNDHPSSKRWSSQGGAVSVPLRKFGRKGAQLWEQRTLPVLAKNAGCRVLLNPLQTCPLFSRGLKQVVTVHDLHFLHHPEWFGRSFYWWNRLVTLSAIRRADFVVAISDYVLNDVRHTLRIPVIRSARVYNVGPEPRTSRTVSSHRGEMRVLCVNPFQPHKNLPRVLEAFENLLREFPQLQLRIVGRAQENFATIRGLERLEKIKNVVQLGYVSDEELAREYAECSVFCYPSLSEGFGLPVLEAAAAGALVVTSTTTCLPEIVSDSAILVNPVSIADITFGLRRALLMSEWGRSMLISRGLQNLERFTAQKAAAGYRKVFDRLFGTSNRGGADVRSAMDPSTTLASGRSACG